jgi:hypothetical protein
LLVLALSERRCKRRSYSEVARHEAPQRPGLGPWGSSALVRSGGAPRPELGIADGEGVGGRLDGVGGVKQQKLQTSEHQRVHELRGSSISRNASRAAAAASHSRPPQQRTFTTVTTHPSPIHRPFIAPPAYPTLCRYSSSPNAIDLDFQPGRDHFSLHCPKDSEWGHSRTFGVFCVN